MQLGAPPQSGEDTDVLWRYVAELYAHLRAMENMRVAFNSPDPTQGKLDVTDTEAVLTLT